jgi:hypothetical protein
MRLPHRLARSALLLVSACGGTLEPDDVAGTYRLTGVDAAPLPYLVYATVECDQRISTGRLTLTGSGSFVLRFTSQMDCGRAGSGEIVTGEREYSGVFSFAGRHIYLNGVETGGLRAGLEGDARGGGFVILVPRTREEPDPHFEMGFEPERSITAPAARAAAPFR